MPRSQLRQNLLTLAFGLLVQVNAWAAGVFVMSIGAGQVQMMIDGKAVRTLRVGETSPEGVRLLEIRGSTAVLDLQGRTVELGLGQSTVSEARLLADGRGQFITYASINGVAVPAMIDTGATFVALNGEHAARMGIDFRRGQRATSYTANGPVQAYLVTLARVQVGDVVLTNVQAAVVEGGADKLPMVLIGMSFLRNVEMRRSGNTMTLSRPQF